MNDHLIFFYKWGISVKQSLFVKSQQLNQYLNNLAQQNHTEQSETWLQKLVLLVEVKSSPGLLSQVSLT